VIQRLRIGQYRRAAARALAPLLHDLIAVPVDARFTVRPDTEEI